MHGQPNIKICIAKQAKQISQYKKERNLILCNLCEWTRNLCIKLVIIKKLYYDALPTKYQNFLVVSEIFSVKCRPIVLNSVHNK